MSPSRTGRRLQHVVLMRFPAALEPAEDAELRGLVAQLPGDIDELLVCRFDSDLTGARTRGYHYLLFTELRDTEALASYVAHPTHQRLARFLESHACERLAFDYYVDAR